MENTNVITYSTSDLAKMWGVSRHSITAMVKKGELPARRIGGRYKIAREDAEAYYDNSVVTPSK